MIAYNFFMHVCTLCWSSGHLLLRRERPYGILCLKLVLTGRGQNSRNTRNAEPGALIKGSVELCTLYCQLFSLAGGSPSSGARIEFNPEAGSRRLMSTAACFHADRAVQTPLWQTTPEDATFNHSPLDRPRIKLKVCQSGSPIRCLLPAGFWVGGELVRWCETVCFWKMMSSKTGHFSSHKMPDLGPLLKRGHFR